MNARGRVLGTRGGLLEVRLPGARVGQGVRIETPGGSPAGTVYGVEAGRALVALHASPSGIAFGAPVRSDRAVLGLPLGACALGRAFDAGGLPLDGGRPLRGARVAL